MQRNVWWVNQKEKIDGRIRNEIVWSPGTNDGDKQEQWHWRTMWDVNTGDIIIHYTNQHIVALSEASAPATLAVSPFTQASELNWGNAGKQITVNIVPLEVPIHKSEIPLSARRKAYENHGPFIQSGERVKQGYFFPVPTELWNAIKELAEITGNEPTEENVDSLSRIVSTDIQVIANARTEQELLRKQLFGGSRTTECGICGIEFPNKYLVTAHIKKRSEATHHERIDPSIVMPACLFGCDAAFESGDLGISDDGIIGLSPYTTQEVAEKFAPIVGRRAPAFSRENAKYFKARQAQNRVTS